KPYPRCGEKPGCQPTVMRHKAHQQEHRDGGQGPLRREGIRDNRQDSPRLLRPEYEADSHKRHGDQSNRNRDAQQQQSDYSRKADQPANFTFHGLPSPASSYFFDYRPRFNASASTASGPLTMCRTRTSPMIAKLNGRIKYVGQVTRLISCSRTNALVWNFFTAYSQRLTISRPQITRLSIQEKYIVAFCMPRGIIC